MAAPSPCSATSRRDGYERRRPDETLLYQLIEQHWSTLLERGSQSGALPDFIVEEFEAYLRCGMLEHRVREVAKPNEALAEVGGVNVHAGAAVPSRDRQRLERLCRYVARPPRRVL